MQQESNRVTTPNAQTQKSKSKKNTPQLLWTNNGLDSTISTLQSVLDTEIIPKPLIILIAEFCHIGLSDPCNNEKFSTETMSIDKNGDALLVHYRFDSDWLNYKVHHSEERRYDYIQTNVSFKPVGYNQVHANNDYGNLFYYEVTMVQILKKFMNDKHIAISIGIRSKNWYHYVQEQYVNVNGGMLGWSKHSVGFHSGDGMVCCQDFRSPYKETMIDAYGKENGDIVGCGYDYDTKQIFYTHNGVKVFAKKINFVLWNFDAALVVLCTKDTIMNDDFREMPEEQRELMFRFNFGDKPFEFDIDKYKIDDHMKTK